MAQVTRHTWTTSTRSASPTWSSPAEYLLMAAMLIEIKSRMLLPPSAGRPTARSRTTRAPNWCGACWNTSRSSWPPQQLDALPQLGRDFLRAAGVRSSRVSAPRFPDVDLARPARGLGRHAQARQADPAPPDRARGAVGARAHDQHPAPTAGARFVEFQNCSTTGRACRWWW